MKKILVLIFFAMVIQVTAFAETQDFSVRYDAGGYIEIIGQIPAAEGACVSVHLDKNEQIQQDAPALSALIFTGADGVISEKIKLSNESYSGKYYVFIGYDGADMSNSAASVIIYDIASEETKALAAKLNSAGSAAAFKSLLTSEGSSELFGIDRETEPYLDEVLELCYSIKTAEGLTLTPKEFVELYYYAGAVVDIKNGKAADGVMLANASVFDASYEDYIAYKSGGIDIDAVFRTADFTDGRMNLAQLAALVRVKAANSHSALRGVIEDCAEAIGLDMGRGSDYEKIANVNRYQVFVKMYEGCSGISSNRDISESFNSAVKSVLAQVNTGGTGSGSGGGNGGGGGSVSNGAGAILLPDATGGNTEIFNDIGGHFAYDAILSLNGKGIISGYNDGSFRPNEGITRAEAVRIITSAFAIPPESGDGFDDVSEGDWFGGCVYAMASRGLVFGADGHFNPNDYIKREDMVVMLSRTLAYLGEAVEGEYQFADSDSISSYAKESVNAFAAKDIIKGDGENFYPLNRITRGETAVIVNKLLSLYGGAV